MLVKTLLFGLTIALSGFAFADSKVGDEVTGQLQIGERTFALPPGKWAVVAEAETGLSTAIGNSVSTQNKRQYLVLKDTEGKFLAAALIGTTLASSAVQIWNDTTCDRNDTLFKDTSEATIRMPTCHLINHTVNFWGGNKPQNDFDKAIWQWYRDNKVVLPYNVVGSTYVRFFSGDFVRTTFWFNPEAVGLVDKDKKVWAESPWHKDNIKSSPDMQSFIDQVKLWSQAMIKNVKATLVNGKPIDATLPSLPGVKS